MRKNPTNFFVDAGTGAIVIGGHALGSSKKFRSALGAVLTNRVTSLVVDHFGAAATGGGSAKVPDLETLPAPVLAVIRDIYGTATSDLFLVAAPIAFLAVLAVVFIKEKPLSTLTGDERRAREAAAAPH